MLADEDVWLGATDTAVEGEWRWTAADNSLLTYFNWDGSQPSDGAGENCVEIRGSERRWNDDVCSKLEKFVCQWDI